jgi:hypothetical protein
MSTVPYPHKPGPSSGSQGQRLWCAQCQTDECLVIESIDSLRPPRTGLVEVACTCVECDFFFVHTASVARVAEVLNRPELALAVRNGQASEIVKAKVLRVMAGERLSHPNATFLRAGYTRIRHPSIGMRYSVSRERVEGIAVGDRLSGTNVNGYPRVVNWT